MKTLNRGFSGRWQAAQALYAAHTSGQIWTQIAACFVFRAGAYKMFGSQQRATAMNKSLQTRKLRTNHLVKLADNLPKHSKKALKIALVERPQLLVEVSSDSQSRDTCMGFTFKDVPSQNVISDDLCFPSPHALLQG